MKWDWELNSKSPWFTLQLKEVFFYKDLILRLTRRDLLASYQQTLFGSLWVVLQPVLTTLIFVIIFSRIARISTDGVPPFLFYLPGVVMWNYFSETLGGTMNTFLANTHVFQKVYFPRLAVPISQLLTSSIRMAIQLGIFIVVYLVYMFNGADFQVSKSILLLPLLVFICGGFAFGVGLIISVLTARYRDLESIMQFALRLFMFGTPVIYPSAIVPENIQWIFWLNPLTPAIEALRHSFFDVAPVSWSALSTAICLVWVLIIIGLLVFKRNELRVMDTL